MDAAKTTYDALVCYLEIVQKEAVKSKHEKAQMILFRAFQAAYSGNLERDPGKRARLYMAARIGAAIARKELRR